MHLSDDLLRALESEFGGSARASEVRRQTSELSLRYRAGPGSSATALVQSADDVQAYVAYRMPATFAAILAALNEVRLSKPDWEPSAMLDVGAGPGTAAWAAAEVWPNLQAIALLERDADMISIGSRLASHAHRQSVRDAERVRGSVACVSDFEPRSLVVAAYLIDEIDADRRASLIQDLWNASHDTLVIVEPGTPTGFSLIREARDQLRQSGAHIIAPCPHAGDCPMARGDWCHFSQRLERTRLQRSVKRGELSYEDEKFSYVAVSRSAARPIHGRVLRHPHYRAGLVQLQLCTPRGLERVTIPRRQRDVYRQARRVRWGSEFPVGSGEGEAGPE